jgi:integrase
MPTTRPRPKHTPSHFFIFTHCTVGVALLRTVRHQFRQGKLIRTVPVPTWVKAAVDNWLTAAGISAGPAFRAINKAGRIAISGFSPKVIWGVVKAGCSKCGRDGVAPPDLRRTCARLCHEAGGELEQIQFLLGHVSVQTTERYLGCKQRLRNAVNDKIGLEPAIA